MMSPSSLALHNLMEHALADSAFCSGGGTICFKCQHLYPHEKAPTFLMTDNSLQLKGADACLVAIALGLGLSVDIRLRSEVDPHWNDDSHHTEDISQAYTKNGEPQPTCALLLKSPCILSVHTNCGSSRTHHSGKSVYWVLQLISRMSLPPDIEGPVPPASLLNDK